MENKMFCFQCQETAGCTGCTKVWCMWKESRICKYAGFINICY